MDTYPAWSKWFQVRFLQVVDYKKSMYLFVYVEMSVFVRSDVWV